MNTEPFFFFAVLKMFKDEWLKVIEKKIHQDAVYNSAVILVKR